MAAKLIHRDTQGQLRSHALDGGTVRIGSAPTCEISVNDGSLGLEHCTVQKEGDVWVVQDLGTPLHTFVNDAEEPVKKHPLRSRDVIRCGSLWLQLIDDEPAVAPSSVSDGASVQAVAAAAAKELLQQKALVQFLQDEKQSLIRELTLLKTAYGDLGRRAESTESERERRERMLALQQQDLEEHKESTEQLRAQITQLESDLATQKREFELARSEAAQARSKAESAMQDSLEREQALAKLLSENKSLVAEAEHLRSILSHKDEVIQQARGTPDTVMTELVALRKQFEETTTKLTRIEVERDVAQTELARRSLAYEQAEEELRRLRHQHEHLERLTVSQSDAGADLTKALQQNATLTDDVTRLRERQKQLDQSLFTCLTGVEAIVVELGAKIYALRAALARGSATSSERAPSGPVFDVMDQLLEHLNDGNAHLRVLRKLFEQSAATPTPPVVPVLPSANSGPSAQV